MKRPCLMMVALIYAVAGTAEAEDASVPQSRPTPPHEAKTTTLKAATTKSAVLSGINFSDPYAPPAGVQKRMIARFPPIRTEPPVVPQGGISFTAGREAPDAPFTGGLKFRF